MHISQRQGVYCLDSTFEERGLPKSASWLWHGGGCRTGCKACAAGLPLKKWWTDATDKVASLLVSLRASLAAGEKFSALTFGDPAVEAAIQLAADEKQQAADASRAATPEAATAPIEVAAPEGRAYLPYQQAGISYVVQCWQRGLGCLVADEMGLGKTIQAAGAINHLLATRPADAQPLQILILCPASLKQNWKNELQRWLIQPLRIYVVQDGDTPPMAQVVVINYDRLVGAGSKTMLAALKARSWDLLVCDECHVLKNPDAQRTKAVIGVEAKPKKGVEGVPGLYTVATRRVFLTGTPILNKPVEAWTLLHALDPESFPDFFKFARRYCAAQRGAYGWDFSGSSNEGELQRILRERIMVRRLKVDVLKELPPKRRQLVVLEGDSAEIRRLIALQHDLEGGGAPDEATAQVEAEADLAHAAGDADGYAAAVARLSLTAQQDLDVDDPQYGEPQRKQKGPAFSEIARVRHQLGVAKVPLVLDHVDQLLDGGVQKLIVFAHHLDVLDAIVRHFGDRAVKLDGRTPVASRQDVVDRFQTDASVQVFVGQFQAAGVGITLTAASVVVCAELVYVPAIVTQAEDRAHRIGQLDSVLVQHCVLDGSLDARIAAALVAKQDVADKVLDRTSPAVKALGAPVTASEAARPRSYPVATPTQRQAAQQAMRIVAQVCDGAQQLDGQGFSGADAYTGHKLADLSGAFTDGQVFLATKMARRYHRQLPAAVLADLGIEVAEPTPKARKRSRKQVEA